LVASKGKRKRSKAMTIMLLPMLIVIFIIGWFMYCMGDQKRSDKIQHKPPKKDYVTIMPIVFEEPQENA
jgi:heme/copper-type cytochrome/quinol oxidase subunit 2